MMRKSMVTRSIPVGKRPCSHLFAAFFSQAIHNASASFRRCCNSPDWDIRTMSSSVQSAKYVVVTQKHELENVYIIHIYSHEFATTLGRILPFHLFCGIALLFAGLVASGKNENAIRPILAVNVRSRPSSATRDSLPLYPGNDCNILQHFHFKLKQTAGHKSDMQQKNN